MDTEQRVKLEVLLQKSREMHEMFYGEAEPDHEALPMFFLFKEDVTILVAAVELPDNWQDKNLLTMAIRKKADEENADSFVFNSESWTIPPEAAANYKGGERFADRADRIEVLSMVAGLRSGELAAQHAKMIRSTESPKLEWQEPMFNGEDGAKLACRFNIFKPIADFYTSELTGNLN